MLVPQCRLSAVKTSSKPPHVQPKASALNDPRQKLGLPNIAFSVQLDDSASVSERAQHLRQDELLYLHPESLAALPQSERLTRAFSTLLKISTAIGSIRDVESLQ